MTRWWLFRSCNNSTSRENSELTATSVNDFEYKKSGNVFISNFTYNSLYNRNLFPFSGANNRLTSSQDVSSVSISNVLATAQSLALAIQQAGTHTPSPDPVTAGILNNWLETHLPVSTICNFLVNAKSFCE